MIIFTHLLYLKIIIYPTTMHGKLHLSHKVTNIQRGEAELNIKLPSRINVILLDYLICLMFNDIDRIYTLSAQTMSAQIFVGSNFSSVLIFVTYGKFRHLGPTNNLGRRKIWAFLKFLCR